MPKWVSLKDLMENPSKYGVEAPRILEIAYIPNKQSITLTPDMTGYYTEQTFKTETEGHKYYPLMHKGKLYLVSNKVAKREVFLRGKTGYDNGPKVLKEQAKLWSNEELGVRGETWNEGTIGILEKNQRNLLDSNTVAQFLRLRPAACGFERRGLQHFVLLQQWLYV